MSFTRFNYDDCRTEKSLEESTGPGRYILNTPGWGDKPSYFNDPQIRMQKWGANLRSSNGGAIDIHSNLLGITQPLSKDCITKSKNDITTHKNSYPVNKHTITHESRATHPAWMYKDLEQDHKQYLHLDPQENAIVNFSNNLNTRLLERDSHLPKIPTLVLQKDN
tara:strand:+ start:88 stop:582 length:495 start_codon:yes stop_codon:yes gene_type:complete